jgi:hypothetical protein
VNDADAPRRLQHRGRLELVMYVCMYICCNMEVGVSFCLTRHGLNALFQAMEL